MSDNLAICRGRVGGGLATSVFQLCRMEVDGIGEETDGELDVAQAFNAIATGRNVQGSDEDRHLLGVGWGTPEVGKVRCRFTTLV